MSILSKLQALLTAANTKTGESDTTLTAAVQTLVDGYGQGGGSGEESIFFTFTPSETVQSFTVNAGTFTLSEYYEIFAHSTNATNDPSHETVVDSGSIYMPYTEMGNQVKNFGRTTTRKAGSGSDYFNSVITSASQTGETLTVSGTASIWFMSGVEYSFYIQNINAWESR